MALEEEVKITEVREIDSDADEWEKELAQRIKRKIQKYIGKKISVGFFDGLVDEEGKREEAWSSTTYNHQHSYISYRTIPLTEQRKEILKERMKERGITECQISNGSFVPVEEYDEFDSSDLVLYLRKAEKNRFIIGIFDIKWVQAGMGIIPKTEKIQDLLTVKYK